VDDLNARLAGKSNEGSASGNESVGVYAYNVLSLTSRLSVMTSLRFEWYRSTGNYSYKNNTTTGKFEQNALSPKLGIVYQVVPNQVSLFANYMNAFQPVTGNDFLGKSFRPQYANQTEGGVKVELLNGKLTSTVSYYDISVTNSTRTDTEHPGFSLQDGTQYSKGVEVEVISNPVKGLNLLLGYAYNDSKLKKAAANVEGKRPTGSGAYNTANCWISYKLPGNALKGLGIGVGGNYSSEQYIVNTTTDKFTLPEFFTIDATVFYDLKGLRLSAKVDNLTSERYWSQYTLAPMAPARYSFNVAVPF
jgi:iron complex outermembrane receptor protein